MLKVCAWCYALTGCVVGESVFVCPCDQTEACKLFQEQWNKMTIEQKRTASASHGICDECLKKHQTEKMLAKSR